MNAARAAANPSSRTSRAAGQGLAEYVLILAIVSVLAIGTTVYLGRHVAGTIDGIMQGLSGVFPELLPSAAPTAKPTPTPIPVPTVPPPAFYTTKKSCTSAGYTWATKPKPAHCT